MPQNFRALSWTGALLLIGTLAAAQPQPQNQPPRPQSQPPQPQDPTPVPAPKPRDVDKPRPEPREPAPSGRLGGAAEMVLSGCLRLDDGPRSQGNPADAPAADAPAAGGYVLRNAAPAGGDARPSAGAGKDYRLVASSADVKLSAFAGQQVKVTGAVKIQGEPTAPAATEAGRSSSQPSGSTGVTTAPRASAPSPLVTLSISKIESIAKTCGAAPGR